MAEVAKIGSVMLFFATPDNRVGYVVKDGDGYTYKTVRDKEERESILALFDALTKQIRTGYFTIPNALVLTGGHPMRTNALSLDFYDIQQENAGNLFCLWATARLMITVSLIFLMTFSVISSAGAEELSDAYMKEYTFLKAQKEELSRRLEKEKEQQTSEIENARQEVYYLQDRHVSLSKELKQKESDIEKARDKLQDSTSNKEIINSVLVQAKMSLEKFGIMVDDTAESKVDTMESAFQDSANLYQNLSSMHVEEGRFYLLDGTTTKGEIVKVGNIAAYGISPKQSGALAPAGNGEYKLWNQPGSNDDAKALYGREMPEMLNVFVYENRDKDVEYQKGKTYHDVLEGGGVIGYVIFGAWCFRFAAAPGQGSFPVKGREPGEADYRYCLRED